MSACGSPLIIDMGHEAAPDAGRGGSRRILDPELVHCRVDVSGHRAAVEFVQVVFGRSRKELRPAHPEFLCAIGDPFECVVRDRDRRLHGMSIADCDPGLRGLTAR